MDLEIAWETREKSGKFLTADPLRIFHGAGEAKSDSDLRSVAIDRFLDHYWVTFWEHPGLSLESLSNTHAPSSSHSRQHPVIQQITAFLISKAAQSIVGIFRPLKGLSPESFFIWGSPPKGRFEVREQGLRFLIQFEKTRHPGLFLDHQPLRQWLQLNAQGLKVLNAFSYTGSLSVAAGQKASHVTSLDLSQNALHWAQENWNLNQLPQDKHFCLKGDFFESMRRFKKKQEYFNCILLDPPSFSHTKKETFSVMKHLSHLHALALDVLSQDGLLITSLHSIHFSWHQFQLEVLKALREKNRQASVLRTLELPETFPTPFQNSQNRYLKGWILKVNST